MKYTGDGSSREPCPHTFVLAPQVPQQQGKVAMAGRDQRLHPALLALAVRCSKLVGLQPLEHEREGEPHIGLHVPDRRPIQDDDPQQVTVGGSLLVEEQVRLQDEPPPIVHVISLFL